MIVMIRERFPFSGTILVRMTNPDMPLILIGSDGIQTYNEFRNDEEKTRFLGVDTI